MPASYTRRINLYINGKEVSNDIVSIRKEMSKLVNEQARMTIGSREYVKQAANIKTLKRVIDQHNNDLSTTAQKWNWFQKMADASNRYFAVITAGIAAVAGAFATVKQTVDAFAEYDDKLVDVMKTTDLTKQQTIELSNEIRKIDTRTAQNDLLELARVAGKLGIRGKADVLGFVDATDKIRVALSQDLGGDTEESVRQLGKLVDIFKLTKDFTVEESLLKIGSAMNALGASGTANEGYMLEFTKRVAGVAPTAGFTIDKILGLATTLDQLGQTSEVSATAFNQVISNMFKKTDEYAKIAGMSLEDFTELMNKDANEALIQLLLGAKGSAGGFGELAKSLSELGLDGVRATTVLGSLAVNIDKLRKNQKFSNEEFVKGIDLQIEFNKKNNSAQAVLDKHVKTFKAMSVQLGEQLMPIYGEVIHKASTLLKVFGATTEFLFKYGAALLTTATLIATYTLLTKALVFWETRKNEQVGLGLILYKLQTVLIHAQVAAVALYTAAVQLLSGQFARAATSIKLFSAALSMTPIGWIIAGITAVVLAIRYYEKNSDEAVAREKLRIESLDKLKKANDLYTESLTKLGGSLKNSSISTQAEKLAMAQLADETLRAAEADLARLEANRLNIQQSASFLTKWQELKLALSGEAFDDKGNKSAKYLALELENGTKAASEMDEGLNDLKSTIASIREGATGLSDIINAEKIGDSIGSESLIMMQEKLAKYQIALENAIAGGEDFVRIQGKIAAVQKLIDSTRTNPVADDTPAATAKQILKDKVDALTASFKMEQALINQNYLEGKITQDEYNHQMLLSELKFLKDKLDIYKVGDHEYQEAVNRSLELQVAVDNKLRDLRLKAEEELASAKIENFRDEFKRQEEAEKQRWEIEKTALELRLIDKVALSEKEQAVNDAIHTIILEKEKAHQQKMRDLNTGKSIAEKEQLVVAATPFDIETSELAEMEKMFAAKTALIEAQYANEKELAAGNSAFMLAAEKRHNDALLQLKIDMIDAEWQQKEQRIAASQAFITALSGMVDQETALGKALFAFNQGLAIAEIWVSLAKANAKALELGPGAAAMIPFNTAIAVAQTALVLAQSVKAFSKPSKEDGYSDGGYTTPGDPNEPAGIVHKSEYVISKKMLSNPQVQYIAAALERIRTKKVSLSSAALPVLSSGGFSTSSSGNALKIPETNPEYEKTITEQNAINQELTKAIKSLMEYRPVVAVETIEREREKYIQIKQTKGL